MPSYFRFIWPTTARFVLAVYQNLALSALNSPLLYGQAPYSSVRWLLYLSFGLEVQAFRDGPMVRDESAAFSVRSSY